MTFQVRSLRKARQDVDCILNWLIHERKTPHGAVAWLRAYEAAAAALATSADAYGLAPEDGFVDYVVRQFLFKTRSGRVYRGLYTIDGEEVLILRVRGPGQAEVQLDELR
jgi:plasmid stabilization system protein ParE